jgi:hypothetical protein
MLGGLGMPPPMTPGPRTVQGGGGGGDKAKYGKLIEAARLLLETSSEYPELAKAVHPIVDSLTQVIRQSAAPTRPPALDDAETDPTLDATPPGGAEGGSPASMMSLMGG